MPKEQQIRINQNIIKPRPIVILPYTAALKNRARALRKAGNLSEVIFWKQVRAGTFHTIDFDRQRVIGNYIVDFYVKSLGLVIEIDGESHNNKEEYDEKREEFLTSLGLKIFKISTIQIHYDLDNVMKNLEDYIIENYKE
jgi:very-short-patch-repair endonuclease